MDINHAVSPQLHTCQTYIYMPTTQAAPRKVGLEPRGMALAVATGACLAAGYSLLQDHDLRRIKKSIAGGSLSFLGTYLFIRGSQFNDVQTAAVVTTVMTLASMFAYSRIRR